MKGVSMAKKGTQSKGAVESSKKARPRSHPKPQEPQAPKALTDDRDIGQYSAEGVPSLMKK